MTLIRIDPAEMETGSNELQAQASVVGETLSGLRAQCATHCLPAAVASQVEVTLAAVEPLLRDLQVELVLEGTLLAVRGILAIKGSEYAGAAEIPAPEVAFVAANPAEFGFTDIGIVGLPGMTGFVPSEGSGASSGEYQVPVGLLGLDDIPSSGTSPVGRAYTPGMSNTDLANSSIPSVNHIPSVQDDTPFVRNDEQFEPDLSDPGDDS